MADGAPEATTTTNDTVTLERLDHDLMQSEARAYQLLALLEQAQKQLQDTNALILELRKRKAAPPA